jgi:asparagine synthase (glutamine-hydrolysing)
MCSRLPRDWRHSVISHLATLPAVPTYYCAKLARSAGVDLLLGGDGGDELFGGNDRYAVQGDVFLVLAHPRYRATWFDRANPVSILLGARHVTLLRKGRGYVTNASIPLPERLLVYNMLRRNPSEAVFTTEFLARIDPEMPLELFRNVYRTADARAALNRILAVDLQFTLADNDLYKVNKMCDLAGVDVAYPMLNDDLVAFSARLPAHLKLKGTRLRYFFQGGAEGLPA